MTLEILAADALAPLAHGFFTRRGGASSGVFSSLNCGYGSSDQKEMVSINRSRVAQAIGVEPENLASVYQVHSARAVALDHAPEEPVEADAMVTTTPGLGLAILTADCQPVLFADPDARVIGAAHAGWKGALHGVLEATIDLMVEKGAARDSITAVIGPSISQAVYEVGPEFLDQFIEVDALNTRYFVKGAGDRYLFDLIGFGLKRLRDAGIGHAEWTGHCTYSDPDRFYSYRRATHERAADYGRLISVIRL